MEKGGRRGEGNGGKRAIGMNGGGDMRNNRASGLMMPKGLYLSESNIDFGV